MHKLFKHQISKNEALCMVETDYISDSGNTNNVD